MPAPPDGFIAVDHLRNLLRSRGYKYKGLSKSQRSHLWRHPQTMHAANLPNSDLIPVAEVRQMLRFVGMSAEDVERFIGTCRS